MDTKARRVGQPPHAVFLPYPTQGHINAMLQLAKLLHSLRGFHISFVNTHHNHRRLLRTHGPAALSDLPNSFQFHAIPDGLQPADNPDAAQHIPSLSASVEKNCPTHLRELLTRLGCEGDAPPMSCIASDTGMSFAVEIAAEFGVPTVLFWTASACGLLGYAQYKKLVDMGNVPLPEVRRLVNETNGRGMLASWCNQSQVLGHPAVGGFLTHCGWNSVIEALGFGIPLVCWPFFEEQTTNSWFCCEKWRIGVEIGSDRTEEVKKEEVARVVREVVEGEKGAEMRSRAREWKRLAEDATRIPNGPSYLNIDKLANHRTDPIRLSDPKLQY